MSNSTYPARPRLLRLQFSLRLALFAFTAFGIGFPIWYRWPYEETEVLSAPSAPTKETRATTWQRQWGGSRLKHGPEQLILGDNELIESTMYVLGRKQGLFFGEGVTGQYVDDMKEGIWHDGNRTMTWHRGLLDGPGEIETKLFKVVSWADKRRPVFAEAGSRTIHLLFSSGRLTQFDGKPATNRLFDLIETDTISPPIRKELCSTTEMSFIETPLKDAVIYYMDRHAIPIQIDPKVPNPDLPITMDEKGLDLCSALTLLTAPHDLGCDYRYGCIWITTAADAEDWHDPTGVMEIRPSKGGALAEAWNEQFNFRLLDRTLLSDLLNTLSQEMGVEIEVAALARDPSAAIVIPDTIDLKEISIRDLLGNALYRTGCRCKLEGDKLVILPPEAK